MEKLSPEDALRVLDQAAGFYKGSRQEHQTLVAAVVSLKDFIERNNSKPAVESIQIVGGQGDE